MQAACSYSKLLLKKKELNDLIRSLLMFKNDIVTCLVARVNNRVTACEKLFFLKFAPNRFTDIFCSKLTYF